MSYGWKIKSVRHKCMAWHATGQFSFFNEELILSVSRKENCCI